HTTVIAASYLAEDAELNKAETYFTQLEYNLQRTIDKIPNTYRYSQYGYGNINERYYNISAIDHNPSEVLAYLTSLRGEFKAANVKNDIKTLFDEMFQLDYREENIIVDSRWDSELGWIPIYHNILYVTLKARSADEVIHSGKKGTPPTPYKWLDGNDMIMYELRRDFRGNRFYFDSSTDFDWTYYAGGNFGYQYRYEDGSYIVNDNSKAKIRAGQKIKAPIAGIIVISGDIISVENKSSGLKIWFGGCSEFVSPEGAQVNKGDEIAVSGDNLSIQAQLNDLPLNPVIFVDTGEMTIQGGEPVNNKNFQVSAGALRDRDFARLIDKARPYIGKRYYFNACDPENSQFDNVGLICYVYNLQLWIPMGEGMSRRALPQDIYTWCGAVPENEIKPGDLAFFAATYPTPPIPDSDEKVATQIGIYVGDGHMLVCGDPIGFANVNTPYWQARLLGYGRVRPASS
ncbi:MAG: C40 family peptidase, partial [Clostridiales bacterium]|nr:C40 family peptidase [Clostridiales bacterium]